MDKFGELKKKQFELESEISSLDNEQMALKILMNACYGAFGNKYFRYFRTEIASAVTLSGQLSIKWVDKYLMEHPLQKKYKWKSIYQDTDSVAGDSIIIVNGEKITIEEYYNNCKGEYLLKDDFNEQYVKEINGDKTISSNNKFELEEKNITYIMKHKVIKEMFEIEVNGNKVVITEDHSIMIKRDNKLIGVKPTEIIDGDELLYVVE